MPAPAVRQLILDQLVIGTHVEMVAVVALWAPSATLPVIVSLAIKVIYNTFTWVYSVYLCYHGYAADTFNKTWW